MVEFVEPLLHKKLVPLIELLTEMVAVAPAQISSEDVVIVNTGNGFTIILVCAMAVHPSGVLTVTLYNELVVGLTVIEFVVAPVFHKNVEPAIDDTTLMVLDSPTQISLSLTFKVISGKGFTSIEIVAVFVQPSGEVPVTV